MPRLQLIIDEIERLAPPLYQESYDNSGLLYGNPNAEIKKVMLCLDCTEEVVDEAISKGCQLIIAHHPIVFKGLKSLTGKNYVERVMIKAIQKKIALYACHTNLDNIQPGVNQKIASRLQLQHTQILRPLQRTLKQLYTYCPAANAPAIREALFLAGAGKIGEYDSCSFQSPGTGTFKPLATSKPYIGKKGALHEEAEVKIEVVFPIHAERAVLQALRASHPYEEIAYGILDIESASPHIGAGMIGELPEKMSSQAFLKYLKTRMRCKMIRHTSFGGKTVQKVAVCGGAGSFLLQDARKAGADAFITADLKYHEFFDAENQLMICDIGHYESEQFTPEIFSEYLSKKIPTFALLKTTVNTNPVNYYV